MRGRALGPLILFLLLSAIVFLLIYCYGLGLRGTFLGHVIDIVVLPGWLLSVFSFHEGIHSGHNLWAISAVVNTLVYTVALFLGWRVFKRRRKRP
jgi:hypothetical protein